MKTKLADKEIEEINPHDNLEHQAIALLRRYKGVMGLDKPMQGPAIIHFIDKLERIFKEHEGVK